MKQLSPREKEILNMVIGGMTTIKIAEALKLSKRTVDAHRRNIIRKSGTPGLIITSIQITKYQFKTKQL